MLEERTSRLIFGAEALVLGLPITMWLPEVHLHPEAGNRLFDIATVFAAGAGLLSFWWLAIVFWRRGAAGLRKAPALVWTIAGICACASIAAGVSLSLVDEALRESMSTLLFGIPLLIPFTHLLVERLVRVPGPLRDSAESLESDVREVLVGINFVERYVNLSRRFAHPVEERFEKFQKDAVLELMVRSGYPVEYHKGDDFFQLASITPPFRIYLNLVLKGGTVELIFGAYEDDVVILPLSGPWGVIARDAGLSDERIRLPVFRNYEDLTQILEEAFSITEDLKKKLLERAGPRTSSRKIAVQKFETPLLEKIERLLNELDKRSGKSAEFFRTILRELKNPETNFAAIEKLRGCYSMTQYDSFSSAEEKLLEEIISLCTAPRGEKNAETTPKWASELIDEEEKFWRGTYPQFSFEERVGHWSAVLMRNMRWQVESGLDPYAIYSAEWRRGVIEVEPDIDQIMDAVFARYWKDLWSREEYLKRIGI